MPVKTEYEQWFIEQSFYHQLRFIHGDRLFDFDVGIGYRNATVQVGYVAYCRADVEFVLGGDHVKKKQSTLAVGQRVKVDFISESRTEFSGERFRGEGTVDRYEDDRVFGRLDDGRPFVCMPSDVEFVL